MPDDAIAKTVMERGDLVAAALAGAWRSSPPPLSLSSADLAEITPLLLKTGGGSLGWWRVRHSHLPESSATLQLKEAYRLHTLRAAIYERELKQVIKLLRSYGVEPLLAKGWAVARFYPEPGLRPYGDIDLCVRPEEYSAAMTALKDPTAEGSLVDLHSGFPDLEDRNLEELYGRSHLASLGDLEVRILGPEDHLRHLCIHLLRHGAWRPLWLCDIGAMLESLPAEFDWDYFWSGDKRRSDWVACALGLAQRLLSARLDETLVEGTENHLPRWLVPAVLRQWGKGYKHLGPPMETYLRHPVGVLEALRCRWPNPIKATITMRGPFNDMPRLPFQIGEGLTRTAQFAAQLLKKGKNLTTKNTKSTKT